MIQLQKNRGPCVRKIGKGATLGTEAREYWSEMIPELKADG